jgi:hypothetical protein
LAAHQTPVDRNRVRCAEGINQSIDAAITHMDIQEFIGAYDQHSIGAAHEVGFTSARIGGALWVHAWAKRVVVMFDHAHLIQTVQDQVRAIRAIVSKDTEFIDANGFVIGQPFQQVRAFVLHR